MPEERTRDEPIAIRGARVHNLQGVDCDLPRQPADRHHGPSGSGKSSLAFDTLYAEGQRRYVESLSPYARQFLEQLEKPEVESVTGLSPAIAIDQRTNVSHPRSTVGTVTEIYDHLRVLFSALGRPHCPRCAREIAAQTAEQMAGQLFDTAPGRAGRRCWPRSSAGARAPSGGSWPSWRERGYVRARIDGRACDLRQPPALDPRRNHRVDVLVDRLILRDGAQKRLVQALEKALAPGGRRRAHPAGGRPRAAAEPAAGLRGLRPVGARDVAPRLLLQQPLRRVPCLRRAGRALAGGSAPRGSGRGPLGARRRHPSLAAARPAPGPRGRCRR